LLHDKKEGYGTFTWKDGSKYCGKWQNGKQHGRGVFTATANSQEKTGEWKDGRRLQWISSNVSSRTQIPAIISETPEFEDEIN
jgi:hypothetical protein